MSMLLTLEEIRRIDEEEMKRQGVSFLVSCPPERYAKAQLKKIVGIHKGIIETDEIVGEKLLKVHEFWEALLKEVE